MARRATFIDETWNLGKPVLMLDAGDLFGVRSRMEREQTRFLCELTREFGYDAIGLGEYDLNYGLAFLREMIQTYGLPFTSANVRGAADGKLILPEYLLVERGGVKFGICSVMDPDHSIMTMSAQEETFLIDDPATVLRDLLPRMRAAGAGTIVLLAHLGDAKSEALLKEVPGIDVCVVGHTQQPYRTERVVDQTAFLASSFEGRYVGRAECFFGATGRLEAVDVTIGDLGKEVADDPVMLERGEAVKQKLELARLAARGPYQPVQGSADEKFLTERECRKCHQAIWEQLRTTPHAAALGTLARKGQSDSPECLVCHTTGYVFIGGYDDRPPGNQLANVQCEACHGYGTEHSRDGKWGARARSSCVTCHDQQNSPNFDYETYWEKIKH